MPDKLEELAKQMKSNPDSGEPAPAADKSNDVDLWGSVGDTEHSDSGNGIQRAFDKLTTVTPEQEQGHSWLTNKAQEFGAGAIGSLSPIVHPLDTLSGVANAVAHPKDTAKSVWADAKEHPAQAIGGLVGGAVTGGLAAEAGGGVLAKIPTKAKAGALFQDTMAAAGDKPVWMQKSGAELNRALELADRGGTKPTTVSKLARRVGNVNNAPMTYREARDFATNLSDLSADEKQALKPVMRRQVGKLSKAFNQDVGDTATAAGVGDKYTQAMRDYSRAARIASVGGNLKKVAIPIGLGAIGAGGIAKVLSAFRQ